MPSVAPALMDFIGPPRLPRSGNCSRTYRRIVRSILRNSNRSAPPTLPTWPISWPGSA